MSIWQLLLHRARERPYLILPGLLALVNGFWHKLKFFLLGKKVKIGKAFRVYGTFRVMGPGRVCIGDNCFIDSKLFKFASFRTILPNALIEVGNNVGFSGTTIQCYRYISIGNWCNIADAYIVDSAAHQMSADRRILPVAEVPIEPVKLDQNVWVSVNVVITHGVKIGENSVVGACSLVLHDIPRDSFYAGIPAKFIREVPPTYDYVSRPNTGKQANEKKADNN